MTSAWGPAGQDAAEASYRIVDAAYERCLVAVTSNIRPGKLVTASQENTRPPTRTF